MFRFAALRRLAPLSQEIESFRVPKRLSTRIDGYHSTALKLKLLFSRRCTDLICDPAVLDLVGHEIELVRGERTDTGGVLRARQPRPHGLEDGISRVGSGHHHQLDELVDLLDVEDGVGEFVAALGVGGVVGEHDEKQQAGELGAEALQDEVARVVARLGAFGQDPEVRAARACAVAERVHGAVDGEEHR